jgi:hypothetical protein
MRTRFILLCILLAPFAWAQHLVIQRVTVIDATGNPAQPDMTVLMERDRIVAVNPWKKARIPKGAQVVDGTGKFLIPGLWDMHVHGAADRRSTWSYPLYLANGVLGVREMFGPPDANAWRAQHAASGERAPRVYLASPIVDGLKAVWQGSIAVASESQGREAVVQKKERGADFIKVYSLLPRDAYFAVADEARKRGIPFAGHVPITVRVAEASDAGQKSIEHVDGVALGCSVQDEALFAESQGADRGKRERLKVPALEAYDEAKAQALFARFVKNGTWQCPTLTVFRSISRLDDPHFTNDDRLKYVPARMRSMWDPKNDFRFKDMPPEAWAGLRGSNTGHLRLVGTMHRAGVRILAGTDTMNPYCFAGFSLHDELTLLVEAGLSPMAALQAATSNCAYRKYRTE